MFKHLLSALALLLVCQVAVAQTTLTLRPGPNKGKDSKIWDNVPRGGIDRNFGDRESLNAYTWTNQGRLAVKRVFLEFDLSDIPADANILQAKLFLYYNPTDPFESFQFHTGNNELYVQRVTEPWEEMAITWRNQPNTTTQNRLRVPASNRGDQNYEMNVTALVQDMFRPGSTGNHGFMVRLVDEINFYKAVLFAASEHPNRRLRPKLVVTYDEQGGGEPDNCVFLKPGVDQGKDSKIWDNVPRGGVNSNYGNRESLNIYTWTNQGRLAVKRVFLEFDFSAIPANAVIEKAGLSLYYNPSDPFESFSTHTAGVNDMYIQRVLNAWDENTITWNNQPATTATNQVSVPPSPTGTSDYNIDMTQLVQDVVLSSEGNNGFMIRMADEVNFYKGTLLASSEHPNANLHPSLEVCWQGPDNLINSTNEQLQELDFEAFPNPSSGLVELQLPQGAASDGLQMELYDLIGQRVAFERWSANQLYIATKGIYLLVIQDENGLRASRKIVIQ
ncbi:MAG: DNRLRE domain-containing protein [Bacteroidota bacterium]